MRKQNRSLVQALVREVQQILARTHLLVFMNRILDLLQAVFRARTRQAVIRMNPLRLVNAAEEGQRPHFFSRLLPLLRKKERQRQRLRAARQRARERQLRQRERERLVKVRQRAMARAMARERERAGPKQRVEAAPQLRPDQKSADEMETTGDQLAKLRLM